MSMPEGIATGSVEALAAEPDRTDGRAVAAFAFAISGLFALPVLGAILGIVLGLSARRRIDRSPEPLGGRNLAVAGIVLGCVGLGAAVVLLAVYFGFSII